MFLKKVISKFSVYSKKVSITESDLSKVSSATLLKSLSVMGNFLRILQKFSKTVFSTGNTTEGLFLNLIQPCFEIIAHFVITTPLCNKGCPALQYLPHFVK